LLHQSALPAAFHVKLLQADKLAERTDLKHATERMVISKGKQMKPLFHMTLGQK
jgi:hypothetical protein